jgi:CRP-like cAMP-binding protein
MIGSADLVKVPMAAEDRPQPKPIDRRALFRAHPFFKDLGEPAINRLFAHAVSRKLKKGAILFRKGEAGSSMYAVCAGSVRISVPSEEGKDAIFNVVRPGEVFGEIALLDGGLRTADAAASEDCELMVIERRDFIPLIQQDANVAMKLIELLCGRLRRTSEQVEDIVFLGLPSRLAKVLIQLSRRAPATTPQKLRVTQRDLSQMIGVSRESANKQLREWERKRWVRLERGSVVILAPNALTNMISETMD